MYDMCHMREGILKPQPVTTHRIEPEAGETVATVHLPAKKPAVIVWDGAEAIFIDPESAITPLSIDPDHKNYIVETLRGTALAVERTWTHG